MSKLDCFDLPQEAANHEAWCRSAARPHYIMVTPATHYTFLTDFLPRCVDDVEFLSECTREGGGARCRVGYLRRRQYVGTLERAREPVQAQAGILNAAHLHGRRCIGHGLSDYLLQRRRDRLDDVRRWHLDREQTKANRIALRLKSHGRGTNDARSPLS